MKKRRRKKIPLSDRHPLERPTGANQVWSMDFVFDRTAEGRSIKSLTVVDDCSGNDAHGVTRPMNAPTKVQIVAEQRQCRIETTQCVPHITANQHAGGPHGQGVRAIVMLALIVFASL